MQWPSPHARRSSGRFIDTTREAFRIAHDGVELQPDRPSPRAAP